MPARKTSTAAKLVTGSRRRARPPAPPPGASVELVCPAWLSGAAAEWHEHFASTLAALGTSTAADASALAELAQTAAEVDRLRAATARLPGHTYETVSATGGTMYRPYPEFAMLETAARRLTKLLSEFGLLPAARSRVQ